MDNLQNRRSSLHLIDDDSGLRSDTMKLIAYTVYDSKSETYTPPTFAKTDGVALRQFSGIANDPEHAIGGHPEDYTLYKSGTFNDGTGLLTHGKLESMANGLELVARQQNADHEKAAHFNNEVQARVQEVLATNGGALTKPQAE